MNQVYVTPCQACHLRNQRFSPVVCTRCAAPISSYVLKSAYLSDRAAKIAVLWLTSKLLLPSAPLVQLLKRCAKKPSSNNYLLSGEFHGDVCHFVCCQLQQFACSTYFTVKWQVIRAAAHVLFLHDVCFKHTLAKSCVMFCNLQTHILAYAYTFS